MMKNNNNRKLIRAITSTGMMIAVCAIMATTVFGTLPLFAAEITISHLPVIIIALLEGPICGLIVGAALGIISMVICITSPVTLLSPFIANPLISVLPRIFIGVAAYYSYALVMKLLNGRKTRETASIAIGAALGSITNTVGVLGMLYIVYASRLFELLSQTEGLAGQTVAAFLYGIAASQGVIEMAVNTILATIIVTALNKAGYNKTR